MAKLNTKENSYYVADSFNRYKRLSIKGTKQSALNLANALNDSNCKDIMDFKGYRYCVLLDDYRMEA